VRRQADLATQAVGLISGIDQAETIVGGGKADFVALARAMLDDPRWPWQAARRLGVGIEAPAQYRRAVPPAWPGRAA
jgi:2,4-dienoyl-CoA reductase-like NADH-dependent reductase (Old Yellow Enzyme family)